MGQELLDIPSKPERMSLRLPGFFFALGMITVGHWTNGTMDHERLFWDSEEFMKQLGLAK